MFIEKVVTIVAIILINFLLSYRFIKKQSNVNVYVLALSVFAFGKYLAYTISNVYIPTWIQIFQLIIMGVIPLSIVLLQYNNIKLSKKILYYKMKLYIKLQDYEKAKEFLYKLIEQTGKKAQYYYLLGICYKNLNNFMDSRDSFAMAVELDKKDYLSYFELGCILDETNKKETAIIMFNNSLRIKPDFYDAAESLGISYTSQARYEEAIKIYKNALKYHPDSCELYYNIAMVELEIGEYDNAESNFEKAASLKPKLYSAYYNIGVINYLKGDYEKAIQFFKMARSSTIYGGRAYYKLAVSYVANQEYEKAMSCLDYAVQIEPKHLQEAKSEMVFEKLRDRIEEYEQGLIELQQKDKDRHDYMKELDNAKKKKELLERKIEADIQADK